MTTSITTSVTKAAMPVEHRLTATIGRLMRLIGWALALAVAGTAPALARISCTAANVTLNYGAYDVLAGAVLDAAGSIQVTCKKSGTSNNSNGNISYSVALTTQTPRTLTLSGSSLSHQFYVDSARIQPWGNGTGGTYVITGTVSVNKNSSATDVAKNFYASVTPGGQDVVQGTYKQSNLTVTVTCTSPVASC